MCLLDVYLLDACAAQEFISSILCIITARFSQDVAATVALENGVNYGACPCHISVGIQAICQ